MHVARSIWGAIDQGRLPPGVVGIEVFCWGEKCRRCREEFERFKAGETGVEVWPRDRSSKPDATAQAALDRLEALPIEEIGGYVAEGEELCSRDAVIAFVKRVRLEKDRDLDRALALAVAAVALAARLEEADAGGVLQRLALIERSDVLRRMGRIREVRPEARDLEFLYLPNAVFLPEGEILEDACDPYVDALAHFYAGLAYLDGALPTLAIRRLICAKILFYAAGMVDEGDQAGCRLRELRTTIPGKKLDADTRYALQKVSYLTGRRIPACT